MAIKTSLTSFTSNLIDYAGLFPPAKLELQQAFTNYLNYLNSDYQFMLSKFICPLNLFSDLKPLIPEEASNNNIVISALGTGGSTADLFEKNLDNDLGSWRKFEKGIKKNTSIHSFEVKLPEEIISSHDEKKIAAFLDNLSFRLKNQISTPLMIYAEGIADGDWKDNMRSLINGIEIHNQNVFDTGFKLRTGGTDANSFPSSEQIAFCIRQCLDRKVPVKFTAGLHHPFPKFDKEIGVLMHGFINVFASGIIAMRHDISNAGIEEILKDNNPANFKFTDDHFSWNDWKIDIADIEYARKNLVMSFGSCSFDEPVEDLKSQNLF